MTGTLTDVLAVARRNIGFIEGPANNQNPYAPLVGHANYQPWCASFMAACFLRGNVALPNSSPYTPTMANGFKGQNRWGSTPRLGAVVFFAWPSMGRIAHVGLVETIHADGTITAIEGNTDAAGGRTGGRVMRQNRSANIAGYGYPMYADPPKPVVAALKPGQPGSRPLVLRRPPMGGPDVTYLQRRFVQMGNKITVDGQYGPQTAAVTVIFKRNRGIVETGFGTKSWSALLGR